MRATPVRALPEDSTAQISEKRRRLEAARTEAARENWRIAADLYMAAFLLPKKEVPHDSGAAMVPTTDHIWRRLSGVQVYGPLIGVSQEIRDQARFFHWPLEFPDVFAKGGFDVVIGNPPWERVKLQDQEFFAAREPEITRAPTADVRSQMIESLKAAERGSPERALYDLYQIAKRISEASSVFAREGGRFPLSGRGDVNTYALFAELFALLTSPAGGGGVIVPTGIATDETTSAFFASLVNDRRLFRLASFENEEFIFPDVHHSFRFCLLAFGPPHPTDGEFSFFLRSVHQLGERERCFTLSATDIGRIRQD